LNSRNQVLGGKLDDLERTSKEIVEVVPLGYRGMNENISRLHAETIAAIFTSRDGSTSSMTANNGHKYVSGPQFVETTTTYNHGPQGYFT